MIATSNGPRFLSRVCVYGPCMACGDECVGDTTVEIGWMNGEQFVRTGYAHKVCEQRAMQMPLCNSCDEPITREDPGHPVIARLLDCSHDTGKVRHYRCDAF